MNVFERTISISWSIDDVIDVCPHLTEEQALDVLHSVKRSHDANIGINWSVIVATAEFMELGE